MNIVAFIPCRQNSKSIVGKNLKLLNRKPLFQWSVEIAQKCGLRTIVNSDSTEIIEIAKGLGVETMLRPSNLAGDETSMFDMLRNEIPKIQPVPDVVVLLQSTTPNRTKQEIESAINLLELYDSVVSVEEVPEKWHPSQVFVDGKLANGQPIKSRATRRQDFPKAYTPTGSIYAFKTKNLEQNSIYGDEVGLLVTESKININSEEDFLLAEQHLK